MVELTKTFVLECEELDRDHKRLVEMVNDITKDIEKGETEHCSSKVLSFVNFAKVTSHNSLFSFERRL